MTDRPTPPDWDARWREKQQQPLEADDWLLRVAPLLPPGGTALDLACGQGRNAVYLAEHGWRVTAVDASHEALRQLAEHAAAPGTDITCRLLDLERQPLRFEQPFDLVLLFFYLDRDRLKEFMAQVRPGGVMVVRTFSRAGHFPGAGPHPSMVLEVGELLQWFDGWQVLRHEEGLEPSKKGGSVAGIVARRPL